MNLQNSTALVTGGSSGIGFAIARMLIQNGARLAITGRDERRLKEAADALKAHPIRADVSSESDVKRTLDEVLKAFGHLDILVNNAGVGVFKNLVDMDRAGFEAVFDQRHRSDAYGTRGGEALHPEKKRQHRQYLFYSESARRTGRHRLLCKQVRASWHD